MNKNSITHLKSFTFRLILLLLTGVCGMNAHAQIPASSYGFQAVAGTYTNLVGGTAFTPVQGDDNCSATTIPLNFTFNFCGIDYTAVRAGSNGYLTFSTGGASTAGNDPGNLGIIKPALFWLWDDLDGGTGTATYTTTGTAPNRVFTFQFKNWEWNWSTTGPNISCQVKLYETTNVIEYQYNPESAPGNPGGSGGASIGICDGAGTPTYLSLNNSTTAPTASSSTFTTNISSKPVAGQIYRFSPPPPCSTASNLPTSGTVAATPNTLCLSGNVTLSFTGNVAMPAVTGITYKWQTSPTAGGVYTDIPGAITTLPTYTTTTPITANAYFKCVVLCNGSTTVLTSSASNQVVVNNPGNPTVAGASRCGPGSVTLSATPPAGAGIAWYASPTGGLPLATTNTYATGYIPTTTTFYAAATSGSNPATPQIGSGTGSTTGTDAGPFNIFFRRSTMQFLYLGTEIVAAGGGGGTINTLAFNCTALPTYPILNYTVKIKSVPSTMTALTWQNTGMTQVYNNASYVPGAVGWQPLTFSTPFAYNGVDNIVVEICWDQTQPNWSSNGGTHQFTNTPNRFLFTWTDGVGTSCGETGTSTSTNLPNVQFGMIVGCEGNRQPVVATINPSPAVDIVKPAVVCNDAIGAISASSTPSSNYTNYVWTPNVADLYTNALATTPYAGGNAPNVYFKSPVVGPHTYYLFASGATPAACTHADTFSIWVQPNHVLVKARPDTICVSGTSVLSLDTIAGYYPGSIQWQSSTDGVNYTNISGATASTYTTPNLSFGQNTYYRAQISAGSAICQSPEKYIVVANPTITSVADSFNCGPGTVTLRAITGGNGTPVWYSSASGGAPIGSGSPFETPYLTTTTNFYVTSGGGSTIGTQVLGSGNLTSGTATYNPFCSGWGGTKIQYLIRASELTAIGIPGGSNITSLAMDMVTGGATYPGFAISMKNTTTAALTTTYESGTTEVFAPTDITPPSNATLPFTFTTPFLWDGTSNVLIQMCWSNGTTNSTGNTVKGNTTSFVATHRGQSDSQTPAGMCGIATASSNGTYSNRPMFTLGYISRCESARQQVVASIFPKPAVDLGPDVDQCFDAGSAYVFDAGVQPNTPEYLWDNGSTSQVRSVTESGTYYVTVTNSYTCATTDTIHINFRVNPLVDLGNDTLVCNGVTLTLDAGTDGHDYFWNTGESGQTIDVNAAGSYNVFVTNTQNCTSADTINVNMAGELPSIAGINVSNNGNFDFQFSAIYPQNVIGYEWDFGDGSTHSYEAAPHHTYADGGNYTVVLKLSSTCGFVNDTLSAHIVGIHQISVSNDDLYVYPNPTKHAATIAVNGALKMEKIEVYNVLGQIVYRKDADNPVKHELDLTGIASGVYTIQIYTDMGTVSRKLEILK